MREVHGVTFAGDQFNPAAIHPETGQTQLDSLIDALRAEYGRGVDVEDGGLPTEVERSFPHLITLKLPILGVSFGSQKGGTEMVARFAFRAPNGGTERMEIVLPEAFRAQLADRTAPGVQLVTAVYLANLETVKARILEVWGAAGEIVSLDVEPPPPAPAPAPEPTPDPEPTPTP